MNQIEGTVQNRNRFLIPVHLLVVSSALGVNLLGDVVHEGAHNLIQLPFVRNHRRPTGFQIAFDCTYRSVDLRDSKLGHSEHP